MKFLKTFNRIPVKYFITKGKGQSDLAFHPGSYDEAVKDADMENWNGVVYTSLIPSIAQQVPIPTIYPHGSELMMIMARCDCRKGEKANAALGSAWVFEKNKNMGGLVAEFSQVGERIDERIAKDFLSQSLNEMFKRRQYPSHYELRDAKMLGYESIKPNKNFGTALVALGFTEYHTPYEELTEEELE